MLAGGQVGDGDVRQGNNETVLVAPHYLLLLVSHGSRVLS